MTYRNWRKGFQAAGLLILEIFTGCNSGSSPDGTRGPAPNLHNPRLNGSFIQSYLSTSFNDGQWRTEFKCMKAAGVDDLFVQSTMDSKTMVAIYPSRLSGVSMTRDVIGPCLSAAKVAGAGVYLGLQSNDDWWMNSAWDPVWLDNEANISNLLADDLQRQYGASPAFKGWYIWFEVDNVNEPTSAEWDTLAAYFKKVCDHLHTLTPGKKVVIAPFYNSSPDAGGMTPDGWQAMWEYILAKAPIDVIALQDGIGAGNATTSDLPAWFGATQAAAALRNGACELWADTENFHIDDNSPMSIGELVADMKAVQPYVSRYLSFSFNHYTSPQVVNPFYFATYLDYVMTGGVENAPPGVPANLVGAAVDSSTIHLNWLVPQDNIGVVGYVLYRDGVGRRLNSIAAQVDDFSLDSGTTYQYQISAFDAAGNESALAGPITVQTPVDPVYPTNLALGKSYTISPPPGPDYPDDGVKLTDGLNGTSDWSNGAWVGSLVPSYSILVDLGKVQTINEVNSTWLQDQSSYIFFPDSVAYFVSENGVDFTSLGTVSHPTSPSFSKKCKLTNQNVQGRYVRIDVQSSGWSFVDEVEVRQP